MDFLSALGRVAIAVLSLIVLLVQTWLLGAAVRRVLGVRTGLVRTFLVSLVSLLAIDALINSALNRDDVRQLAEQHPAQFAMFGIVVALWCFAASAAVLVGVEILLPTGSLPAPQHLLLGWRRRWRQARRNTSIMAIAAKHGLSSQLRGFGRRSNHEETARSLRNALNESGVTFIKLGQMLSTRADLLPEVYVRELSTLQNRATPLPWADVDKVLTDELGRPVGQVFSHVDHDPLASASLGQVHRATLLDGRPVVVKVQRPGAAEQVHTDLATLSDLARQLQGTEWARTLGLRGLVDGFADSLREELSYTVEAANTRAIAASAADRPRVVVPKVAEDLSTDRVLVMDFLDGTPLSQSSDLVAALPAQTRAAMASDLLGTVLHQVLRDGVFHADLHAGNLMVWPNGRVGLLDFGSAGRLDAGSRAQLVQLLWAVDNDDSAAAMDALLMLLDPPDQVNERALQRDLGMLITRMRAGGDTLALFGSLMAMVIKHGFQIPPMLAAALRALGALEGTLRTLNPDVDLVADARDFGQEQMRAITPETLKNQAVTRLAQMLPMLDRVPRSVARITEDLEQGTFSAHVRILSHPEDRHFVTGLVHQLAGALLAAAAVLGGILLVTSEGGPGFIPGLSLLALFGYLLTFAGFTLALRVVAQMYHRRP